MLEWMKAIAGQRSRPVLSAREQAIAEATEIWVTSIQGDGASRKRFREAIAAYYRDRLNAQSLNPAVTIPHAQLSIHLEPDAAMDKILAMVGLSDATLPTRTWVAIVCSNGSAVVWAVRGGATSKIRFMGESNPLDRDQR